MDYTTLIAAKGTANSLADRVNYAPVADRAAEIVKTAQDEIFTSLRVREMRKSLTFTLATGTSTAPLPSDFLDFGGPLRNQYGSKCQRVSEDELVGRQNYDANNALLTGFPAYVAVLDGQMTFDCAALQTLYMRGFYYGATYINDTTATSFLTTRYSQLFWAVLLKHGFAFAMDEDAAMKWDQAAQAAMMQVLQNADLDYRSLEEVC